MALLVRFTSGISHDYKMNFDAFKMKKKNEKLILMATKLISMATKLISTATKLISTATKLISTATKLISTATKLISTPLYHFVRHCDMSSNANLFNASYQPGI